MPLANQYLLLYLLDLLSVFARKSDKNRMTPASACSLITSLLFDAVALIFLVSIIVLLYMALHLHLVVYAAETIDLAVIFRPAVLSHPDHEMLPQEHRLSQEVLEFLIAHQDWFMLDITPPTGVGAEEELDAILSSDDEANGGSWMHDGLLQPQKLTRRRTTTGRHNSK